MADNDGDLPYDPSFDDRVHDLAAAGNNRTKIAAALGLTYHQFKKMLLVNPSLARALKMGQWDLNTGPVENALLKRALGFSYEEVKLEAIVLVDKDGDEQLYIERKVVVPIKTNGKGSGNGKGGKNGNRDKAYHRSRVVTQLVPGFKRSVTVKYVPPDIGALCFWLCNREPDDWKNVQRQIVEGKVDHQHQHLLDLTRLKREELEQLRDIVAKGSRDSADADGGGGEASVSIREPLPLRLSDVADR